MEGVDRGLVAMLSEAKNDHAYARECVTLADSTFVSYSALTIWGGYLKASLWAARTFALQSPRWYAVRSPLGG